MIQFEATTEFRDEILKRSKEERIQFQGFIRKVLKEYLENKRIKKYL